MSDFALAALAHEHIRELQHQAAEARLAREATARRRSSRAARQPAAGIRLCLSRLRVGSSAQPVCCVA